MGHFRIEGYHRSKARQVYWCNVFGTGINLKNLMLFLSDKKKNACKLASKYIAAGLRLKWKFLDCLPWKQLTEKSCTYNTPTKRPLSIKLVEENLKLSRKKLDDHKPCLAENPAMLSSRTSFSQMFCEPSHSDNYLLLSKLFAFYSRISP